MRFNYKLYRPKKTVADITAATSAYFKAKDVRVTPLTKIGDVAQMPKPGQSPETPSITKRRPIFTKTFDRSRFAIRAKTTNSTPARQTISVRRITNQSVSTVVAVRKHSKRFLQGGFMIGRVPKAIGLAVTTVLVGIGLAYVHAYDMTATKSSVTAYPANVQTTKGTDTLTNQQKNKAKKKAAAKKNAAQQKAAADAKPTPAPAADTTGQGQGISGASSSGSYDYDSGGASSTNSYDQPAAPVEAPAQPTPIPDPVPALPVDPPAIVPPIITTPMPDVPDTTAIPDPQITTPDVSNRSRTP